MCQSRVTPTYTGMGLCDSFRPWQLKTRKLTLDGKPVYIGVILDRTFIYNSHQDKGEHRNEGHHPDGSCPSPIGEYTQGPYEVLHLPCDPLLNMFVLFDEIVLDKPDMKIVSL